MKKIKIPKLGNYKREKLEPKPLREATTMKKRTWIERTWGALKRTLGGDNKTGEIIHGVLDLLPIPNQIIAKVFSDKDVDMRLRSVFTWRNVVAAIVTILVLSGVVTLDQLYRVFELFGKILNLLNF